MLRALAPFIFLFGLAPLVSVAVNYLGEAGAASRSRSRRCRELRGSIVLLTRSAWSAARSARTSPT